ncbi:MAG: DUF485 domain-containing protein [Mycobacteriales bacterium]|nr:DUF485 domain-containing protein [Mycobacteriales bacterium]
MSTTHERSATYAGGGSTYAEVQATDEFQGLKRTLRRFVFPATVLFLAWYLGFVLLTAYARDLMDNKVLGEINVAYVLGLLQFVSTFAIAFVYSRYADKHFDPTADRIRERLEADEPSGTRIDLTDGTPVAGAQR